MNFMTVAEAQALLPGSTLVGDGDDIGNLGFARVHSDTRTLRAGDLFVAEATVKTHVGRLLAKTGSRDRVQLVVLAHEAGLI